MQAVRQRLFYKKAECMIAPEYDQRHLQMLELTVGENVNIQKNNAQFVLSSCHRNDLVPEIL